MKTAKPKKIKKRVFRAWITSAVSISMVLVMLGALLLILINAERLSDYVREKIGFTLVLHDEQNKVDIKRVEKILSSSEYVKSVSYINKESAANQLSKELGENFVGFLGFNPLFSSFDVKLYAKYTNADSLMLIEKEFMDFPQVKEVYYQKNLVNVINENVKKIGIVLLIASALTGFIFVSLINNTIRISIYSERFTINTMQIVGATKAFVRKPFLIRGLSLGFHGAIIANGLLLIVLFVFKKEIEEFYIFEEFNIVVPVMILVVLLGMVISYISTWFAVNKFLRMKFDELFY